MKNVLVVLVLLAAALGVYWLATSGEPEPGPGPGRGQAGPPRVPQRPVLPEGAIQPPGLPPGAVLNVSEEVARRLQQQRDFPWKDTVTDETLVAFEDAWSVDLSAVDFDADVLCTVNGEPVRQEDFRRRIVLKHGQGAVRARLLHLMGQRVAAATGQPFGLTDEQWERYLEVFAESRQASVEEAKIILSHLTKLPVEGSLQVRREILEGILALYPPVEFAEQLPEEVRSVVQEPGILEQVLNLSGMLASLRAELENPDAQRKLAGTLELTILLAKDTFENDLFRRSWTAMDAELPDGVVAGYATGALPRGADGKLEFLPPWALPGAVAHVPTDEMFALLGDGVARYAKQEVLEELIWSVALRQRLAGEGALPEPERTWMDQAGEFAEGQTSALSSRFLIGLGGFTSETEYRENMRLRTGFADSQPEGWGDEDDLREFFDRHRFFIQAWQPDLSIAYFPPYDPATKGQGPLDWERAREEAQAFYEAVTAAPEGFDAALEEHHRDLAERYRQGLGDSVAQQFLDEFQLGRVNRRASEVDELLKVSPVEQDLHCASLVRNAVVRLESGEVSPPWRTPIGYVVVRLNSARLARLEEEFEDLELATREEFARTYFRLWVNGTLTAAKIEVP